MNPLLNKLQSLDEQRKAAFAKLDATDDIEQFPAIEAEIGKIDAAIDSLKAMAATRDAEGSRRIEVHDNRADKPWASFGEQLQAIIHAGMPGGQIDPRLVRAAASGASALVGTDGGFAVGEDYSTEIFKRAYETGQLASRCSVTEISANSDSLEVPYIEETSRATGSRWGGIRVYRANEADSVTGTKVTYGKWECRLEDLKGLAYMTNRLLEDAAALESVMRDAMTSEFAFTLDSEIFEGNGVGRCMGIMNSAAKVTVAKEGGQAADSFVAANATKMLARLWEGPGANSVWFINRDVFPQLPLMTVGQQPVYLPPNGMAGAPLGTLFGRPVLPIEQCNTVGDEGDIVLANLSQYKLIRKGGLRSDVSMHVRFIYDEMCFRFGMRVNGSPMWKTALTPYKGANTLSPFVTLADRA